MDKLKKMRKMREIRNLRKLEKRLGMIKKRKKRIRRKRVVIGLRLLISMEGLWSRIRLKISLSPSKLRKLKSRLRKGTKGFNEIVKYFRFFNFE